MHMTSLLPRIAHRSTLLILVLGWTLPLSADSASAAGAVAASRGTPSSLSARYGAAISLGPAAPGRYLVPTRTGFEIRQASLPSGDSLVATFRSAGRIDEAAVSGTTAWLAAGNRGLLAVDLAAPASPGLLGSIGGLGTIRHVAAAPAGQVVAAVSDSSLYLFRETGAGALSLLAFHQWTDGRILQRVVGRNDSILVAASRPGALPRLFVTLFRVRAGAAPESLWDFQANGHQALDLVWREETAFFADANNGILPLHLPTRQLRPAIPVTASQYVQSLDADDSLLVAAAGAGNFIARFRRGGAFGDSLTDESDAPLPLAPSWVRLIGDHAILSCDSENDQPEPDEVGRSVLLDRDLSIGVTGPPVGATGRVRRVVEAGGLAYVADYTGGLRIYRGASTDSSLVGALAPSATGRTYDLALDAARRVVYLASGGAGLEVVDVTDPAAPARLADVPLPGHARCVAAIGDTLVAAGWKVAGKDSAGVTFLEVSDPSSPLPRGSVSSRPGATILDPRALAPRDTVLFVADFVNGVISATFGNPDLPGIRGVASGVAARSLDVTGATLLAATRDRGIQVVDVTVPSSPALLAEVPLPSVYGVTQQGSGAVAFLGDEGAVLLDLSSRGLPVIRGIVDSPGFPRDGNWSGDTLMVASSFGLERFTLPASLPAEPSLSLSYDELGGLPRVTAAWAVVSLPGVTGLALYREPAGAGSGGGVQPVRVNGALLPPATVAFTDAAIPAGGSYRYRLEAILEDGGAEELAVGTISIPSTARAGRPYPNPFRPTSANTLSIPFRIGLTAGAAVRVRIYDVRGRLIRTITTQPQAAGGFGSVAWDGQDGRGVPAAAGRYWLHIQGPGIDDARSVVLVR